MDELTIRNEIVSELSKKHGKQVFFRENEGWIIGHHTKDCTGRDGCHIKWTYETLLTDSEMKDEIKRRLDMKK